jgi:tetratricopeptide (TPR) repeat protein
MRIKAPLVFTAGFAWLSGAADPGPLSLAESPVLGLSARVETHLARDYDCTVISRARPVAATLERSIDRMRALCAAASPPDALPAAEVCAWVTAWDESLSYTDRHPVDGIRELAYAVSDLSRASGEEPERRTERVPARSEFERTLARRIAEILRLPPAPVERGSADKTGTLAVLPLIRLEDYYQPKVNETPDDTLYRLMEAELHARLPDGADLLSRDRMREILAEHHLAGLFERDGCDLRAVSHLLPARALVCGVVTRRLYHPKELRLDLHLVDTRNSVLLAAWEGRCAETDALPGVAAAGIRELMAMPWREADVRPATAAARVREARFMASQACYAAAWSLARDQPDLFQPIFNGVLGRVSQFSRWMQPVPDNPDAFRNLAVQEACVMLEDLLKRRDLSGTSRYPPPELIRAEMRYWLGDYAEAERLSRGFLSGREGNQAERAAMILAWTLCKQERYDESRDALRQTGESHKNMWSYLVLDGSRGIPWGNALNKELAARTGDWSDVYAEVRKRMCGADLYSSEDMAVYLREVEKREGPEKAILELSALLTSYPHLYSRKAVLDRRAVNMTLRCPYVTGGIPAYVTRARCYETVGDKQRALDDYALFLRIMRYFGYDPDPKKWQHAKLAPFKALIPAAEEAVRRLEAEGFKARDEWRSMAEVRPFPRDCAVYVVPVGVCDRKMLDLFVEHTAGFLGARVVVLPAVPSSGIRQKADRRGSPEYDGRELVDAVLKRIAVPDDVVQLALVTSEVFRIEDRQLCYSGSFDEGNTVLISLKDHAFTTGHQMRDAVLLGLHYRYTPRYTGPYSDRPSLRLYLRDTESCCAPCIFGGDLLTKSGEANGLCAGCQEAYGKADIAAVKRQTLAALKKQGVKIIPAPAPAP